MNLRRIGILLLLLVFVGSLSGLAVSHALSKSISDHQAMTANLRKSGIYGALIPDQLLQAQKQDPAIVGIPFDNPDVQRAIQDSFRQEEINQSGDTIVNSLYRWLEGESEEPEFAVTVTPDREKLATTLGDLAAQKVATLPECAPGQIPLTANADPFRATCVPPALTTDMARGFIEGEVLNNLELSPSIELTDDNLQPANNTTIGEAYSYIPGWYQQLQTLPLLFASVAAVTAAVLLWLLRLRRGVVLFGVVILTAGVISLLTTLFIQQSARQSITSFGSQASSQILDEAVQRFGSLVLGDFKEAAIFNTLVLLGTGSALLIAGRFLTPKNKKPADS